MPITPFPPELQRVISGQTVQSPLGQGLDQFMQSLQHQQEGSRTIFDALGRQTPGFASFVTQNYPDIIDEMTGPPKLFRPAGQKPLSARLQEAMQAYTSQPPPAEAPLSGEQVTQLNEHVKNMLDADPRLRGADPDTRARAGFMLQHALRAPTPEEFGHRNSDFENFLGGKPTDEMVKFQRAMEVLSDPRLGYQSDDEKAAAAYNYATGHAVSTKQQLDNQQLDASIKEKQLSEADLRTEILRLEKSAKENAAETGTRIPIAETEKLGHLSMLLKTLDRFSQTVRSLGPLETTMGYVMHAPLYSDRAAQINAQTAILGPGFERLGLEFPGRMSPQLIDMMKGGLVSYSDTPTQLHAKTITDLNTLLDMYHSKIEELEAAGYAKPAYFDKEREMLKHYEDLSLKMSGDKAWAPKAAPGLLTRIERAITSPFGARPQPTPPPSPGSVLFPPKQEEQQ